MKQGSSYESAKGKVSPCPTGFEFKYADAPGPSRSMHSAIQDLGLEQPWVIYPEHEEYSLYDRISVIPLEVIPRVLPLP